MHLRMPMIDWAPFEAEFPLLFGRDGFVSYGAGAGWFELIWGLCVDLEKMNRTRVAEGLPPHIAIQIKEKFGELKFYLGPTNSEARARISLATIASRRTCEACGRPGNTHEIRGWFKTYCLTHELLARKWDWRGRWTKEADHD